MAKINWRSIKTAPRDGTVILIHNKNWMDGTVFPAYWDDEPLDRDFNWHGIDGSHFSIGDDAPTHWMPLPPPPQRRRPMTGIHELIARAACSDCDGAEFVEQVTVFEDGSRHPLWEAYLTTADAILAALDASGIVLVPREPTEEMAKPLTRLWLLSDQEANSGDMLESKGYLKAALAASPYAKKDVK